jgi:hypothetical protein
MIRAASTQPADPPPTTITSKARSLRSPITVVTSVAGGRSLQIHEI